MCLCIFLNCLSFAQVRQDRVPLFLLDQREIKFDPSKVRDPGQLQRTLREWQFEAWKKGQLLSGLDSVVSGPTQDVYYLYGGPVFKTVLVVDSSYGDSSTKDQLNVQTLKFQNPQQFTENMRELVRYYADRGFPFCQIGLLPVQKGRDTLSINIRLDKGPAIAFHSCEQREEKVLRDYVFDRISGVYKGRIFSQKTLDELGERLNRLPYVKMSSEPRVLFLGQECVVWVYPQKVNASKFDILLGLNPFQGPSGTEYRLTGEGGFDFQNVLKCGEQLRMKYENLSNQSPNLQLLVDFPFIPSFPLGAAASLDIYRYREEYVELSPYAALTYSLRGGQRLSLSYRSIQSHILNVDTLVLIATGRLPAKLDYSYGAWGLHYDYNSLDQYQIPRKGVLLQLSAEYGKKEFLENNTLLSFDSEQRMVRTQYDSLNLNTGQARFALKCEAYTSLARRSVLKWAFASEAIWSASSIVENELFRMGGASNLRGFDEDFYRCSQYGLFSLEYRFLLDPYSFLNVFNDFAYLKQPVASVTEWNYYNGFGLGIQFQTKVGAFKLQYALGTSKSESIQISKGKIHFGYTQLF